MVELQPEGKNLFLNMPGRAVLKAPWDVYEVWRCLLVVIVGYWSANGTYQAEAWDAAKYPTMHRNSCKMMPGGVWSSSCYMS